MGQNLNKQNRLSGLCAAIALGTCLPALAATSPNVDTADYVMNDFDSFSKNTNLGGYWFSFTDNGSATAIDTIFGNSSLTAWDAPDQFTFDTLGNLNRNVFPQGHGGDSTDNALRFGFKLGDRMLSCGGTCTYPAYVGFGLSFKSSDTVDLSAAAGVAFWAKADTAPLTFNVSINTRDTTTGAAEYSQTFKLDTTWKLYVIKLVVSDSFKQPDWSPKKPFVASRATGMGFGMNAGDNALHKTNAMWIDDLVIQKWKYVEPEIPVDTTPIPDAIFSKAKHQDRRFGIQWAESGLRVRLPSSYEGQSGRVQALDSRGRILSESSFHAQSKEVTLPLASRNAGLGSLHFRVIAEKANR